MTIVMAFQMFSLSARVSDRVVKQTAARDLARSLLAAQTGGGGRAGSLRWQVSVATAGPGLALRTVTVSWPGGPALVAGRLEARGREAGR